MELALRVPSQVLQRPRVVGDRVTVVWGRVSSSWKGQGEAGRGVERRSLGGGRPRLSREGALCVGLGAELQAQAQGSDFWHPLPPSLPPPLPPLSLRSRPGSDEMFPAPDKV